jgi:hypothetical protein
MSAISCFKFFPFYICSSNCSVGILNYNQCVFSVWRNHDFVCLGSNSNEDNFLFFVNFLDSSLGVSAEVADDLSILVSLVNAHSGLDGHALCIYNNQTDHTDMSINAVDRFFNFS